MEAMNINNVENIIKVDKLSSMDGKLGFGIYNFNTTLIIYFYVCALITIRKPRNAEINANLIKAFL